MRSRRAEVRSRKAEVRSRRAEVRSRKAEVRSRNAEVGSQKAEVRLWKVEVLSGRVAGAYRKGHPGHPGMSLASDCKWRRTVNLKRKIRANKAVTRPTVAKSREFC